MHKVQVESGTLYTRIMTGIQLTSAEIAASVKKIYEMSKEAVKLSSCGSSCRNDRDVVPPRSHAAGTAPPNSSEHTSIYAFYGITDFENCVAGLHGTTGSSQVPQFGATGTSASSHLPHFGASPPAGMSYMGPGKFKLTFSIRNYCHLLR